MKNKGYTLIELLGVMIILALLITVVFPSIINFIKSSNEKKDNLTRDLVYNAAEMFIEDNASEYYSNYGSKYCISINTLIENNYLKGNLEYQGETLNDTKSVEVTYTDKFNYEIIDTDECTVCKLVSDADGSNSITPGDKYQCKVKNNMEEEFKGGYYFYVLSQDTNDTTNLIMDRNINSDGTPTKKGIVQASAENGVYNIVEWVSKLDYNDDVTYDRYGNNNKGPITVMNFLYNATKGWTNVPDIEINYIDEGNSYGGIKTTNGLIQITKIDGTVVTVLGNQNGYQNLKARMPYLSEMNNAKNNRYLYDYLSLQSNNQDNPIEGINGYWVFASYKGFSTSANALYNNGYMRGEYVYSNLYCGVRPVITIPNSLISK